MAATSLALTAAATTSAVAADAAAAVTCFTFAGAVISTSPSAHCWPLTCIRLRAGVGRLQSTLDVVAVSQAPTPESNPNSPSPVKTMVGLFPTIESLSGRSKDEPLPCCSTNFYASPERGRFESNNHNPRHCAL